MFCETCEFAGAAAARTSDGAFAGVFDTELIVATFAVAAALDGGRTEFCFSADEVVVASLVDFEGFVGFPETA